MNSIKILPEFQFPMSTKEVEKKVDDCPARAILAEQTYLGCYTDLLKSKNIEVWFDSKRGLSARIHQITSNGKMTINEGLPLVGLPREISQLTDTDKLQAFFRLTHLLPEKGIEGICNRVSVHISGKGGVKSAIPFQPGLALGTIVRMENLLEMEKYAETMAEIQSLEDQIRSTEDNIKVSEAKLEGRSLQLKSDAAKIAQDPLCKLYQTQIVAYQNYIGDISVKIVEIQKLIQTIPHFSGFKQGVVSPIDINSSKFETQSRGFDTLKFSSEYIKMDKENSEIHSKMSESTSAMSSSIGASGWGMSVNANYSRSDALAKKLVDIKKSNNSDGVLVVNATVTTRNVRCISDIRFNKDKLRQILDAMKKNNEEELKMYGISTLPSKDANSPKINVIYILTEAVMGGSFNAVVTFLKSEDMKRNINDESSSHNSAGGGSVSGGVWGITAKAALSVASGNATKSENDVLNSIAQTKVKIEFISEGAVPTFARQAVETEIFKHLDLNPSKFELTKKDEEEIAKSVTAKGEEAQIAVMKQQAKMENNQLAILNTTRGLTSVKDKQTIHTMESIMEAYDDFTAKITTDKECGVPVGFYYQVLTQEEIQLQFDQLSAPSTSAKPAPTGSSETGSTTAGSTTAGSTSGGSTTAGSTSASGGNNNNS